jgi:hypothetical protein
MASSLRSGSCRSLVTPPLVAAMSGLRQAGSPRGMKWRRNAGTYVVSQAIRKPYCRVVEAASLDASQVYGYAMPYRHHSFCSSQGNLPTVKRISGQMGNGGR